MKAEKYLTQSCCCWLPYSRKYLTAAEAADSSREVVRHCVRHMKSGIFRVRIPRNEFEQEREKRKRESVVGKFLGTICLLL